MPHTHFTATMALLLAAAICASSAQAQDRSTTILTLDGCRERALLGDATLRAAELDIGSAIEQKRQTRWLYAPKVGLQFTGYATMLPLLDISYKDILGSAPQLQQFYPLIDNAAFSLGMATNYTTPRLGWGAMTTFTQPLFAGGRIINGNRLADLGVQAARLKKDVSSRDRLQEIDCKFFTALSLEAKQEPLRRGLEIVASLEEDTRTALDAGLVTQRDLQQVLVKKKSLEVDRAKLLGGIRLAKMDLLEAMGMAYTPYSGTATESRPYIDDIHLDDELLSGLQPPEAYHVPEEQILSNVGESKLLDLQVRAKKLERRIAIGEALPTIGLGGAYGYTHILRHGAFNGGLFAQVSIPLTAWGASSHKARRLGYEVDKAVDQKASGDEMLLLKARLLWVEMDNAYQTMMLCQEALSLAETSFSSVEVQFKAGLESGSSLLQEEAVLRQAGSELLDAKVAYAKAVSAYRSFVTDGQLHSGWPM